MNNLTVPDQYADTLHKLDQLSRNHLLFFRLEVGKLLLAQFFNGDPAAYLSKDSNKPQSFNNFIATCAVHLGDIGLSEAVVRQCIVAHLVVQSLPPLTANKLPFSQVLELTKVEDTATRGLLAHAAVENHWTTRDLRGAVDAARAGIWIDGDLKTPGLQPPQSVPHSPGRNRHRCRITAKRIGRKLGGWWRGLSGRSSCGKISPVFSMMCCKICRRSVGRTHCAVRVRLLQLPQNETAKQRHREGVLAVAVFVH